MAFELDLVSEPLAGAPARRSEAEVLLAALRALAAARDLSTVMEVVRRAARELTRADGVTFVLREESMVHYADEDAIGPLWKGRRFPASACISGWAMLHRQSVVVEDVFADPRVPADAYRPTFVKSLAMVPIRVEDPLGAIGAYWSRTHRATARQVANLEALAGAAAVAVANADLFSRLDRAVRIRDEFLTLASHELNTPLTAVRLRVDVLSRAAHDGAAPSPVELARLRGVLDRLEDVVAGLGAFSRASRDGFALTREEVDVGEVVRRAAERVAARARVEATETPIYVEAPPAVVGRWDPARVRQAVTALLDNAVKFGRGSPVRVEVTDSDGEVAVSVRDEGPGIPSTERERIFRPFERAAPASSHGGLGLGLWLARAIAEAHGGSLRVESAPGVGAAFTLRLPRRLAVDA